MNPHFIHNTLQMISGMAVVNKVPEINSVTKSLGKMIRYSINMSSSTVSIQDEIENVTHYLEIQKLRFREFFNYEIYVEEDVFQYEIIKLTLQPIVENAIIHGIEPKGESGRVRISGQCINDLITIEILDNGVGLTVDEVARLFQVIDNQEEMEQLPALSETTHNSIGLRNINQRIKLIFGPEYGLTIDSVKNEWTRVIVKIPARPLRRG
jgi:two-component system sensor histidine kinase YesM